MHDDVGNIWLFSIQPPLNYTFESVRMSCTDIKLTALFLSLHLLWQVDVYSFGILLYTLYTRHDPYDPISPFQLVEQVVAGRRPNIEPNLWPRNLELLVKRCWAGNPDERPVFDSIAAVLAIPGLLDDDSPESESITATALALLDNNPLLTTDSSDSGFGGSAGRLHSSWNSSASSARAHLQHNMC